MFPVLIIRISGSCVRALPVAVTQRGLEEASVKRMFGRVMFGAIVEFRLVRGGQKRV